MVLMNGAQSISKDDFRATLERIWDEEALEIWVAYFDGRKLEYPGGYLAEFITSRVRKCLEG